MITTLFIMDNTFGISQFSIWSIWFKSNPYWMKEGSLLRLSLGYTTINIFPVYCGWPDVSHNLKIGARFFVFFRGTLLILNCLHVSLSKVYINWRRNTSVRLGYGRLRVRPPTATYQKSLKDGTSSSLAYARQWKVSTWKYGWSARCQLLMWLGGVLLSSACDRSVPVWQHSTLSHAGTVAIWLK